MTAEETTDLGFLEGVLPLTSFAYRWTAREADQVVHAAVVVSLAEVLYPYEQGHWLPLEPLQDPRIRAGVILQQLRARPGARR